MQHCLVSAGFATEHQVRLPSKNALTCQSVDRQMGLSKSSSPEPAPVSMFCLIGTSHTA